MLYAALGTEGKVFATGSHRVGLFPLSKEGQKELSKELQKKASVVYDPEFFSLAKQ